MNPEQDHYFAYLMRLWPVRQNGEMVWRASLENPHTGERRGFSSLEKMYVYLQLQTAAHTKDIDRQTETLE